MGGRWNSIGTRLLCVLVFIVGVEIHGSQSVNDNGRLQSLKCLWLSGNNFKGIIPGETRRLKLSSQLKVHDESHIHTSSSKGLNHANKSFENNMWQIRLKQLKMTYSGVTRIISTTLRDMWWFQMLYFSEPHNESCYCDAHGATDDQNSIQNLEIFVNLARRKLQERQPIMSNLVADNASYSGMLPPSSQGIIIVPITRGSGVFPAIPNASSLIFSPSPLAEDDNSDSSRDDGNAPSDYSPKGPIVHDQMPYIWDTWMSFFIALMVVVLLATILIVILMCRRRVRKIGQWSGLTLQLQKAFVTGVPKLNRVELETACEDFSNIIHSYDGATMYKGTLSSGVEIAVTSTTIASRKEWSKRAEKAYRKKINTLSRVNHKNFVNLLGFCEEDEPFCRTMVFEYAPNGTLFEHIHVEGMEHLDWTSRVRIIMGVAYCLLYMHDLIPPVPHTNLTSHSIYLTDDYAAKIAEVSFMSQAASKAKPSEDGSEHSEPLPNATDPEMNVYCFGVLLLEVISGKLPYSEKEGPIEKWAAEYFSGKDKLAGMVDQSLKGFKSNELEVLCEVAQECLIPDPKQRPSMKQIVPRLREVINIKPDQAVPMLSPLWWAALELNDAS